MKVLWFSNTPASGADYINLKAEGGGWLKSLDKEMQNKVDLHIAFHYPKALPPFKFGQADYYPITVKNWRIHMVRDIFFSRAYDREFEEDYLQLINKIEPDIIHIHGTENPFACIIGKTNIPVVISIQGNITVIAHKYLSGLDSRFLKTLNINFSLGFKTLLLSKRFSSDFEKTKKMAIIESRNIMQCQFIIGRTDWDRRITSIIAPGAQYFHCDEVLRNGFYNNIWSKKKNHTLLIHSTSANSFFKGFETICQSLQELNKLGLSVNWQVAGIKDSDLIVKIARKKLKKSYPKQGLKLLGNLSESDLISKMLDADVFVMASHIENSSNSLCEAMMLGMPCIATFAGGTGSLIKNGEDGILIQDGDPWVLAGAVLELAKNPEMSSYLGKNARLTAHNRHNKEKIIKDLVNTYTAILQH